MATMLHARWRNRCVRRRARAPAQYRSHDPAKISQILMNDTGISPTRAEDISKHARTHPELRAHGHAVRSPRREALALLSVPPPGRDAATTHKQSMV
eukprot:3425416-Prymnesium_polylepis.1